jgi:hypothetical protein
MQLPNTRQVLVLADEFIRVTGDPETTLSNQLFKESKKLRILRGGADLTLARYRATIEWFSSHWPDGAKWPPDLPRPEPGGRTAAEGIEAAA